MEVKEVNTQTAYTYIWAIENCPILLAPEIIKSPVFQVDFLQNTKWHIAIEGIEEQIIRFFIVREKDQGSDSIELVFEISFLSFEGLPFETRSYQFKIAQCDSLEYERSMDYIFRIKRTEYLANDTLTLRCRMWRPKTHVSGISLCYARTRLGLEKRTFFWGIRDFSHLQKEKKEFYLVKSFEGTQSLSLALFVKKVNDVECVFIKVCTNDATNLLRFNCEISVINGRGKKFFRRKYTDLLTSTNNIFRLLQKKDIMDRKTKLLPNDVLTVRCEFQIGSGVIWSKIEHCVLLPFSEIDIGNFNLY
ncbi:speckle-type POZ protein B [Nephila pilipes]|uniref:Speckle-type POZ protein B n=1 Tax=Nephila pilipes TaxID=299642 RepID=A0A8X6Q4K9_NEPPI|nr:speckle-type POZ protein B [Nephila pilipes]